MIVLCSLKYFFPRILLTSCSQKKIIVASRCRPLVNTSLISQFWENVISFNFLANALFLLAWCRRYFMFQSEHVILLCSWNMPLVRSWWESAHLWLNLWSVYYVFIWWDLVPTSAWVKLHPVPTAMLIVTMISIRTHSVLRQTVSML